MTEAPTTFQRIQIAALETFAEHGFEASGIRQIAERAGIPTSLLYHYSRSKNDLLRVLVVDGLRRMSEANRLALDLNSRASERLAALVAVHVFVHADNRQMARLLDTELRVLDGADRAAVVELRDEIDALWRQVLEEGVAQGEFSVADTQVARLALIRMCNGVATWFSADGRLDVVTLAGLFGELALAATRSRSRATGLGEPGLRAIQEIVRNVHSDMPGASSGQISAPANGGGTDRRRL